MYSGSTGITNERQRGDGVSVKRESSNQSVKRTFLVVIVVVGSCGSERNRGLVKTVVLRGFAYKMPPTFGHFLNLILVLIDNPSHWRVSKKSPTLTVLSPHSYLNLFFSDIITKKISARRT